MNRAGRQRIFASLWYRASLAISGDHASHALIPGCLFAVIAIPFPLPQTRIPYSARHERTSSATG